MKPEYVMALDAGTGAARCFLVSLDGRESCDAYQEWQYSYPQEAQPGGVEFDPQAFWRIFATLIAKALKENQISGDQVVGISSTSQREGVVFLDAQGCELYGGPNIDMRAPSNPEFLQKVYGEEIYGASGHWPFPMFAPYRLLWFKEHKPKVYESIKTVLLINDWILYRLSGEKYSEPSNGNETLLLDMRTRQWNQDLAKKLGLTLDCFAPVVRSGTRIGGVTAAVAAATGLREGTPVVTGGGDTQCALLGTGSVEEGQISTVMGTFAPSQMVVSRPIIDPRHRAWSGCHVVPDRWVVEDTAMEAGQTFRWIRDVFYGGGGTEQYPIMDREACSVPIGAHGVKAFIGPRIAEYTHLEFNVRGGFYLNLPPAPGSASRADFARAALESVAYAVRANLERIKAITGVPIKQASICGGLSKSNALREAMANVLNIQVNVPVQKEGSAMGAALCAAVGSQRMASFQEAAEKMIHLEATLEPEPDKVDRYEQLYQAWRPLLMEMHGASNMGELE